MGAQVMFEIDLEILSEISQESVLRAVRLFIDNQIGRSSEFELVEHAFSCSHERVSRNAVECVRGWKLSHDQPIVNDWPLSAQSKYSHLNMSSTEEAHVSDHGEAQNAEIIPSQAVDHGCHWLPESWSFEGIPAPGPPTFRNELEDGSRGRTMSRRGRSSSVSRSKDSAIPYRPNSGFASPSSKPQDIKSPGFHHQKSKTKKDKVEGRRKDRSER